ncbi:MAG: tetratricopeptide repeat protein [Prevotella sp.]|nr:tetratricopeptide repeat protein [Prevotella sp.]
MMVCLAAQAYNDHRNARVDSLETALKGDHPPKGADLLRAYDELMRGWLIYDSAKAGYYGRKALSLSYELNGLFIRQNVLRYFAQMHYAREEYDEAIALYRQAMAVVDTMATMKRYTEEETDDARSAIYGNLANVYNMQDKAQLAIHYYQLALSIFEKYDWQESQVILYYNIGELYGQMGNIAETERNYQKAIAKAQASGDSLMMALPLKGLAGVYLVSGLHDKALKAADEALVYFRQHSKEEPADYAYMLAMKARILMMEGHKDVAAAKDYVNEALPYIDSTEMMFDDVCHIYMAACEVAMAEKQWQRALDYGLKSVHPDSTATISDKGGYMLLAEIYTELGQKTKTREYFNKTIDLMNRYATDHYQSGLSQMEVLYETEKKEALIAAMEKEKRLYGWLLAAAAGLVTMFIGLFIYRHIAYRRQKALLAAKVALETETKERRILARDLHDSLGGMLSLLKIKCQGSDFIPLLDATIEELRRVSHHLMPEELLRNGLAPALNDFAISVPRASFQSYGDIRLSKEKELTLYRCAYELVNNAMKHAKASHIDIQLMSTEQEITLTVSDDGKGMKTNAQTLQGAGLQNIRDRIEPYNGTLRIVSNENDGTEINVTIPL